MTLRNVLLLLLSVSLVCIVDAQIPASLQKKILKRAPEMDANGDGEISAEELQAARDKLPGDWRDMLDVRLTIQSNISGKSESAKPAPVKADVPERKGPTPFLDPLFKFTETKDIQYAAAKSADTEMPLLLDIYRPTASTNLPEKLPAVILIFGGGWIKGSKDVKYIRDLCEYYATRGYVAFSIQYRIKKDNPPAEPGPAPSPATNEKYRLMNAAIHDTANAVRWVRANAGKYDIAPDRIAIGGVSAGAFNSLYVGFCGEDIVGPNAKVAAVISLMGALELKYIDKDDPPVFIAHGTLDNVVPYAMVESVVKRLSEVKAKYAFYPVEGVAHRIQTILDTEFDGKTVRDHSVDFCFTAMKLSELLTKKD
jgi:acetyl esterase/lipase